MFNDIYKEIDDAIQGRTVDVPKSNLKGTIMSVPGTERIVVSTTIADFMTCAAIGTGPKAKERYCIVHKNIPIKYNGQYVDSNGHPVSVVSKVVFDTFISILNSTNKHILDLNRDLDRARTDKEAAMMTLNALRKNGVID